MKNPWSNHLRGGYFYVFLSLCTAMTVAGCAGCAAGDKQTTSASSPKVAPTSTVPTPPTSSAPPPIPVEQQLAEVDPPLDSYQAALASDDWHCTSYRENRNVAICAPSKELCETAFDVDRKITYKQFLEDVVRRIPANGIVDGCTKMRRDQLYCYSFTAGGYCNKREHAEKIEHCYQAMRDTTHRTTLFYTEDVLVCRPENLSCSRDMKYSAEKYTIQYEATITWIDPKRTPSDDSDIPKSCIKLSDIVSRSLTPGKKPVP